MLRQQAGHAGELHHPGCSSRRGQQRNLRSKVSRVWRDVRMSLHPSDPVDNSSAMSASCRSGQERLHRGAERSHDERQRGEFGSRRGGDGGATRPGDLGFRGIGDEPFDEHTGRYDDYGLSRYDDEPRGSDLGTLTNVVLVGSQVIDVTCHPVAGSGYECAVLDLQQRGLYQRPISHEPPPAPPPPPPHERQLAWLATIVGEALLALESTPLPDEPLDLSGVPRHLHTGRGHRREVRPVGVARDGR